jgi:hypothetical protein
VAFHQRITLELREGFTGLVGAARPHAHYFSRAGASEAVDQAGVVPKVLIQQSPHASGRSGSVFLHGDTLSILAPVPDAEGSMCLAR